MAAWRSRQLPDVTPTLRAYFDSRLPPAEGRSVADEFIAERRAEAAHEASGGQPGT